MTRAPEEVLPAHHLAEHRLARARRRRRARQWRGRARAARTPTSPCRAPRGTCPASKDRGAPRSTSRPRRAADRSDRRWRLPHDVGDARVVEGGEEDEHAEPDVAVGVPFERLEQRRGDLRGRTAAQAGGGAGARRVIEIAQVLDRVGDGERDLPRWSRLRGRRLERRIEMGEAATGAEGAGPLS